MRLPREDFADPAWTGLEGGYRVPYDPRPALRALEHGDTEAAWAELWNELHHQGDIGTASYAAVPHLVRIYESQGLPDSNAYAMIAVFEECRLSGHNPALPDDFATTYHAACRRLAEIGTVELRSAEDATLVCNIIAIIAFVKGQRFLGSFALNFDEDERREVIAIYDGTG